MDQTLESLKVRYFAVTLACGIVLSALLLVGLPALVVAPLMAIAVPVIGWQLLSPAQSPVSRAAAPLRQPEVQSTLAPAEHPAEAEVQRVERRTGHKGLVRDSGVLRCRNGRRQQHDRGKLIRHRNGTCHDGLLARDRACRPPKRRRSMAETVGDRIRKQGNGLSERYRARPGRTARGHHYRCAIATNGDLVSVPL